MESHAFDLAAMSRVPASESTSLTLRKFPPEIRDMVYKLTFASKWSGKTSALIIALRGDPGLYHEALKVFYETNTFAFTRKNQWMCTIQPPRPRGMGLSRGHIGETSVTAMRSIKHAIVNLPSILHARTKDQLELWGGITSRCGLVMSWLCSITHLTVEIDTPLQTFYARPFLSCIHTFRGLMHMSLSITQRVLREEGLKIAWYLDTLSDFLGVKARLLTVPSSGPMIWEWSAKEHGEWMKERKPTLDIGPTEMRTMVRADRELYLLHLAQELRSPQFDYVEEINCCKYREEEIQGMEKLFENEDDNDSAAPTEDNEEEDSEALRDCLASNSEEEYSDEHEDQLASHSQGDLSYPDSEDDANSPSDQDAGGNEEQRPQENRGNGAAKSGSENGDSVSEADDGSDDGDRDGDMKEELSEQDDKSDEDFVEEEASGSEWGEGDDDDED